MQNVDSYIARTESAVRKLFEGIEFYIQILDPMRYEIFTTSQSDRVKLLAELDAWRKQNAAAISAAKEARRIFFEESFAMSILCGAVLQIAAKAIEICSAKDTVTDGLGDIFNNNKKILKYCIGRNVWGVPMGLVIYAGRNQHAHYNDNLNPINTEIFNRLASFGLPESKRDPAFDLSNPKLESFASNITAILNWRSYDNYEMDLRTMLGKC